MEFHEEAVLLTSIKNEIDKHFQSQSFAVFDVDGTLWKQDVNDLLLNYQQINKLRNHADLLGKDYEDGKNRFQRCKLFASRQEGFSLEEFRLQSLKVLEENPLHIFNFQKELLKYLKSKNIYIYLLTASIKWLVEEVVKFYQLPVDQVLGFENRIKHNQITSELIEPLSYGLGKKELLLKTTNSKRPLLAAGNTLSDLPFLEISQIPFVVQSASSKSEDYLLEQELNPYIKKYNWIAFRPS